MFYMRYSITWLCLWAPAGGWQARYLHPRVLEKINFQKEGYVPNINTKNWNCFEKCYSALNTIGRPVKIVLNGLNLFLLPLAAQNHGSACVNVCYSQFASDVCTCLWFVILYPAIVWGNAFLPFPFFVLVLYDVQHSDSCRIIGPCMPIPLVCSVYLMTFSVAYGSLLASNGRTVIE